MKKLLTLSSLITMLIVMTLGTANATTGACSGHGGVACNLGADTDGSVICLDGWRGSSVKYINMKDQCASEYIEPDTNPQEIFSDVTLSNKNRDAILYLYNKDIISGYNDGTFKPFQEINRAELLKILVESSGETPNANEYKNCFEDVKEEWYAKYVCYSKSIGWIDGYPDGTYKPAQTVNKVETIKMVLNSQNIEVPNGVTLQPFEDVSIDAWYAPYVVQAKEIGLLEETGSLLMPSNMMKRASVSEIMYRALTRWVKEDI